MESVHISSVLKQLQLHFLSTYRFRVLQICLPIKASVRTAESWSRVLGAMFVILTDAFRSILSCSDKNTLFIGTMCNLADLCFCKIIPQTLSVSDHRGGWH